MPDSPGSGGTPPSGGDTNVVPGGGFGNGQGGGGGGTGTVVASLSVTIPSSIGSTGRAQSSTNTQMTGNFLALNTTLVNVNAFQIVSQAGSSALSSVFLTDPANTEVLSPADFRETTAVCTIQPQDNCLELGVNALPYRANPDNPAVQSGKYQQTLYAESAAVLSTLVAKNDPDLNSGLLRVNIFLVGNDAQDEDFKNNILPQAIAVWKSIYAKIGITIQDQQFRVDTAFGILPIPLIPASLYSRSEAQSGVQSMALNMFIGTAVSNDGTENPGNEATGVLGIAAAIPGAAIPSDRSAVAISISGHTGSSGRFDSLDKITIFGETMAHEAGHYLGLFHPVESDFESFDRLTDTTECSSFAACTTDGLIGNVMFPFPVEGAGQTHFPQQDITVDQGTVVNFQVLVD